MSDSGNGYHLLYPVDELPTEKDTFAGVLADLATRFDTPDARVDTATFNPSRLVKLPGTYARKGDHTPDRPHRLARVLEVPRA